MSCILYGNYIISTLLKSQNLQESNENVISLQRGKIGEESMAIKNSRLKVDYNCWLA